MRTALSLHMFQKADDRLCLASSMWGVCDAVCVCERMKTTLPLAVSVVSGVRSSGIELCRDWEPGFPQASLL